MRVDVDINEAKKQLAEALTKKNNALVKGTRRSKQAIGII